MLRAFYCQKNVLCNNFNIHRIFTFAAVNNVKRYIVILFYLIYQAWLVHKNFFIGVVFNNKAETFGGIVEFNFTGFHCNKKN